MNPAAQSRLLWPGVALLLLLTLNAWLTPGFLEIVYRDGRIYGSLVDIALRSAPLILVSLGMTLVIAIGAIDLSVGAIAAVAPAVAALALQSGWGFGVSLAAALTSALAIGFWNGILVSTLKLQPIVATLIAMVAGRGIAQLLLDGQIAPLDHGSYAFIGSGSLLGVPVAVCLAITMLLLAGVFARRTAAGLFIEAVGSNPTASRFIGLNLSFVRLAVFTLCGLAAGAAGLLVSANIRAVDANNLGLYLELDAVLAVVIGGTRLTGGRFTLLGTVLGALIIQTVSTTIHTQGIAVEVMLMAKASVVILVCLLQSEQVRKNLPALKWKSSVPFTQGKAAT